MDNKREIERWRNRNNNAWGNYFEKGIEAACRKYRDEGRAVIAKVPEPFRVLISSAVETIGSGWLYRQGRNR